MKKKYKVLWSRIAENDLARIIEYIALDNKKNAFHVLKRIKEKASKHYITPELGPIVPELQDQGIRQYRELVIPPWRIIYRTEKKHVYVLAVFDSRRNFEDILFQRLIELSK